MVRQVRAICDVCSGGDIFLYLSMKIFEGNVLVNMNATAAKGEQGMLDQIVQYIVIWFLWAAVWWRQTRLACTAPARR